MSGIFFTAGMSNYLGITNKILSILGSQISTDNGLFIWIAVSGLSLLLFLTVFIRELRA